MINFFKPLEPPPQLRWKFAHEPELLGWTIRARDYNTFIANCMFGFMTIVILGASIIMYSVYKGMSQPWRILSCISFYSLMLYLTSSVTHQRMNFAYRFTQSGVEECEWKNFPQWVLTFLKWFTPLTVVLFIFLATIDPTFLIGALIGPGGMTLTYLTMANSKTYQRMHTQYHHYAFEWSDFTQLAIATNREVVDLKYSITMDGNDYITNGSINFFCKRRQKEQLANFIKPYLLPGVPFIRAKVDVPMSTD